MRQGLPALVERRIQTRTCPGDQSLAQPTTQEQALVEALLLGLIALGDDEAQLRGDETAWEPEPQSLLSDPVAALAEL